jgi:hypothetical protein
MKKYAVASKVEFLFCHFGQIPSFGGLANN